MLAPSYCPDHKTIAGENSPSIKQTSACHSQHRFTIGGRMTWVLVGAQTEFNAIVDHLAQFLLASDVPLGGLYRGMPQ